MADLALHQGTLSSHRGLPTGAISRTLSFAELNRQSSARTKQVGLVIEHILARRMRKLGSYRRIDGDTYQVDFSGLNDDDATVVARLLAEEIRQKLLLS
jgi:hypothetical protein